MEVNELINYCYEHNLYSITVDEMKDLLVQEKAYLKNQQVTDEETTAAIDCLCEVMASHKRTFSDIENKLIETGVLSGRCYVCWHENKYYPGATVDNLRKLGFNKFYETYKGNWEKIKKFRKELIARKNLSEYTDGVNRDWDDYQEN